MVASCIVEDNRQGRLPANQIGGRGGALGVWRQSRGCSPTFGISYAPCVGMEVMLVLLALMFGAFMTLPVWGYSAKWKLYPCSACFGLATIGALLVVAGVI